LTVSTVFNSHRILPGILSLGGIVLLVFGAVRLPAHFHDLSGNVAAEALQAGNKVAPAAISRVLETRTRSAQSHTTAQRWFALGRAYYASGNPEKSHVAFARGLQIAPADGVVWAAYARALKQAGESAAAAAARKHSIDRAPHDPRAVRLRRK
jgi:cytochrome c-type biogenesis protein CcmH/NrfG